MELGNIWTKEVMRLKITSQLFLRFSREKREVRTTMVVYYDKLAKEIRYRREFVNQRLTPYKKCIATVIVKRILC